MIVMLLTIAAYMIMIGYTFREIYLDYYKTTHKETYRQLINLYGIFKIDRFIKRLAFIVGTIFFPVAVYYIIRRK